MKLYRVYPKYYELITKKHYIVIAFDDYKKENKSENGSRYYNVYDSINGKLIDFGNYRKSKKNCINDLKENGFIS